ncbi:unnamed protein product [Enterobius vermicularis]|uniref:Ion_trans domain-containing protein n=1 Tax=Enterobius vermicularis TaxID=51028 RepID=A0A0N4UTH9_ENTVE|nr:unnamed protein product [Enterobius vermicularis]
MVRRRKSKVTRVINLVKHIIAFFFSHVGLCALVVGYALLGAVVFKAVEGPHETRIQSEVTAARNRVVNIAWSIKWKANLRRNLFNQTWKNVLSQQVKKFQVKCMWAIRRGYDGKVNSAVFTCFSLFLQLLLSCALVLSVWFGFSKV